MFLIEIFFWLFLAKTAKYKASIRVQGTPSGQLCLIVTLMDSVAHLHLHLHSQLTETKATNGKKLQMLLLSVLKAATTFGSSPAPFCSSWDSDSRYGSMCSFTCPLWAAAAALDNGCGKQNSDANVQKLEKSERPSTAHNELQLQQLKLQQQHRHIKKLEKRNCAQLLLKTKIRGAKQSCVKCVSVCMKCVSVCVQVCARVCVCTSVCAGNH